ncbi:hypothetical protein AAFF_G00336230 [Aldrovandia affinis]|uniref:Transport and Golgi organization protein 1 homolog n=1 Tax=Aldrovandia affinis TaxID=143900 RepID=A0AAD7R6I1_9TELE|nr:hypothetical protein AAFF_G00336230 [Aldrovandia affinis]
MLFDGAPLFDSLNATRLFHLLQAHATEGANMLLSRIPGEWQPGPSFYGLSWNVLVTVVLFSIIFLTIVWRTVCAVKSTISKAKENEVQILEKLLAEQSRVQQLEEKVGMLEQAQVVLQREKVHQELLARLRQRNVDTNHLSQDAGSSAQLLSEVSAQLGPLLAASISSSEQHVTGGDIPVCACHNVAELENIAEAAVKDRDLYMRKVCDEESKSQELEGKIQALKEQREALKKEIYIMGIQNRSGEAKLHNMREQWQQKDQAFQQKAAQLDFERREKQLKVKEVLRFHKQKVETIEKEHVETELSYKTEIDNLKKELQEMKACVSTKDRKHLHKQQELSTRVSRRPSGSNSGGSILSLAGQQLTLQRKPLLPPALKTRRASGPGTF